jgi:hypothetical protein
MCDFILNSIANKTMFRVYDGCVVLYTRNINAYIIHYESVNIYKHIFRYIVLTK